MGARWTCPCGLLPLKEVALEQQAIGLAANEMKALRVSQVFWRVCAIYEVLHSGAGPLFVAFSPEVDLCVPGALVGEPYLNISTFAEPEP